MKYFGQHCPACNGSLHRGLLVYQTNKCLTNPIVCNHYYCFKCLYGNITKEKSRLISKFVHEGEVLVNVQCLPYFLHSPVSQIHWFSLDSAEAHSGASVTVMSFLCHEVYAVYLFFFLYESVTYIYIYLPAQPAIIYKDTTPPPQNKKWLPGDMDTFTLFRKLHPRHITPVLRIQCPRNSADCRARAR